MTESIYKEEFLYHYKNQSNNKKLVSRTHFGKDVNTSCGDEVSIELKVDGDVIKEVGYNSGGCIISTGAVSILSDFLIGKNIAEVKSLTDSDYINLLGLELTHARKKCALVGFNALKYALK